MALLEIKKKKKNLQDPRLQLNALTSKFSRDEFRVLAVPCNQFGHQEPAANKTELLNGLKHVRPGSGFIPHFDITMRSDVNGEEELEMYTYFKERCPAPTHTIYSRTETFWEPLTPTDISWNFEKILVSSHGVPLLRFMPDVEPNDLVELIADVIGSTSANVAHLLTELEEKVATRTNKREAGKKRRH